MYIKIFRISSLKTYYFINLKNKITYIMIFPFVKPLWTTYTISKFGNNYFCDEGVVSSLTLIPFYIII